MKYSPWPENVSGYEAIRHWKINKYYDYLLYSKPARIYYRDRKDNLTSPETTLKRSLKMAEAIDILLHNYGVDMLKYAKNKYYYYILTQSLYYCLSGKTTKSLTSLLKSFNFNMNIKNNLMIFFIITLYLFPMSLRCKVYIYIKSLNYNYS